MSSMSNVGGDLRLPSWTFGDGDTDELRPLPLLLLLCCNTFSPALRVMTRARPPTAARLREP